ncbi:MAG: tetratricopeptide repeat protein, partial [Gemmatimonadota bacterium]
CIADALHVTLRGDMAEVCDVSGPSDLEAYDLYLKGRFHWNRRTADDLTESVTNLKSAIERDPDFALARAALAEAYVTLAVYGYRPAAEALSSARSEAEAALAVDPAEASALSALACVRAIHDWTWDAAETAFLGAIEANPQYATAAQWYATNLLIPLGRYDEAIVQLERARAVDPMSPSVRASFGLVEFMRADYETAFGTFDMLARRDGGFTFAHYYRGLSLLYLDRHREAIDALRTARDAGGGAEVRAALGCAEAAAGREDDARVTLERLIEGSGATYVSPVRIAQLHACLSEPEEALDRLEEAVASRAADLIWLDVFPPFASLRDHPRYAGIRDKVFGKEQADG